MSPDRQETTSSEGGWLSRSVSVRLMNCGWLGLTAWHYDRMASPYWRLYWNANAGASVALGDRVTPLTPSCYVLISPFTPFDARLQRPVRHLNLQFTTEPGRLLSPGVWSFPITASIKSLLAEIVRRLHAEGEQRSLTTSLCCQALVYEALRAFPDGQLTFERRDERVERVVRIMEVNLSKPLPIAALAQRAGMHCNTLTRLFKQYTGHGPQDYCIHLRMEKAVMLLLSTRHSMEEIAEQTGFCSRFHLSRAFKHRFGNGPAAFRKMHGVG
ncbi:MAG: helix-turn-helix domain-containing protein [Kiritimatiellae bacterium]|nr:helix-turn-helix domain-containing protein [Kiritimatiellia bacterium]